MDYISTKVANGLAMDYLISYLSLASQINSQPVGFELDTSSSSPALKIIDIHNNIISTSDSFWANHKIWGNIRRCVRDRSTGIISYGSDNKGTGLTLDGTAGDVLVELPSVWIRVEYIAPKLRIWVIPSSEIDSRFSPHPAIVQRGGALNYKLYVGAYEAYGYLDGDTFKLGSATGKQPVTGGVNYPDLPNSGRFTIYDAETYANNIGAGFGNINLWTWVYIQLLMYIEFGTLDLQTALGKGVVNLDLNTGFGGKSTGSDNIDSMLDIHGTCKGPGTNGSTPICWRGIENPWGNIWKFIIGINMYLDGSWRALKRDGSGTPAGVMADGSYEVGTGTVPLLEGWITALNILGMGATAIVPSVTGGSSSTYFCDYFYAPSANPSILLGGGCWSSGTMAGPASRTCQSPTHSNNYYGARIEYIPQA